MVFIFFYYYHCYMMIVIVITTIIGGSLTFSAATRVRIFLARGAKLERKWTRLRISKAPLAQKLVSLPTVFWSAGLHGALCCIFAESHIHQLRKKAVAALWAKVGGPNPLLRLSLAKPSTADPGFTTDGIALFTSGASALKHLSSSSNGSSS